MPFPELSPIAIDFGWFQLRWYALAYIAGLMLGWRYMIMLAHRPTLWPQGKVASREAIDDLLFWVTLSVIIGGRLGYVVFYNPAYYVAHPSQILAVWQGGMAFHGGAAGVILAVALFAKKRTISILSLGDMVAATVPIGLFFGRIANFINSELWGRTTQVSWGIIFPNGGPQPRHPSQLYEAALEGLLLFALLNFLVWRRQAFARPGLITGLFLLGYGLARALVELVREPDAHIGLLAVAAMPPLTMGQILSVPMMLAGGAFIWLAYKRV